MLIDTHAHVNFNAYKEDSGKVIKRALDNNVWMINVGSQFSTSRRAVRIAEEYPEGVYAAIGLHPIHLADGIFKVKMDEEEIAFHTKDELFDYEGYKELAKSKKVVAVGEIGFDYWYRPKTKKKLGEFKEKQKEVFLQQVKLAKELGLPIIFHCRVGHGDLIEAIKDENDLRGVIHCYTGNEEDTKVYLNRGFYIGFNGLIFKMDWWDKIIKDMPLDKILIETDCPYLMPPQIEGRNEPLYVKYVAERIAKLKNLSYEEIAEATTKNAKELFKI